MTKVVELINNIIYLGACYGKIWDVDALNGEIVFVDASTGFVVASFVAPADLIDDIRARGWESVKLSYLTEENAPERLIHED